MSEFSNPQLPTPDALLPEAVPGEPMSESSPRHRLLVHAVLLGLTGAASLWTLQQAVPESAAAAAWTTLGPAAIAGHGSPAATDSAAAPAESQAVDRFDSASPLMPERASVIPDAGSAGQADLSQLSASQPDAAVDEPTFEEAPPVAPAIRQASPTSNRLNSLPLLTFPAPADAAASSVGSAPDTADPYAAWGQLYGLPGATRTVYLIDASGSQVDTLPFVLSHLQQALQALRPQQSFAVLFFAGNRVIEVPPVGMKKASDQAVLASVQWIDPSQGNVLAAGATEPDAAFRRALAYQPDAIVLVSDGITGLSDPAGDQARLINLIDLARPDNCRIHTLELRRDRPQSEDAARGTLELLAMRTGGTYRWMLEAQLAP